MIAKRLVLWVLLLSVPAVAQAQHAGGCACGKHQLPHPTWELDLVTSTWRGAAATEFEKWDDYIDPFGWTTGDDAAGDNGKNEILWFDINTTFNVYGILIDTDVFGVTFIDPPGAFGNFNACPGPPNVTCGLFTETDIIMNADFSRGWTTGAPNFNDTGPANFGATALHELGHALGLHHNFDNLSTMNYFEDFATIYLARADARIARIHFPSQVRNRDDAAIYPFRYTGSGNGYTSTIVASADRSSIAAGGSFVLRNFTIENIGNTTLSDVRYQIYLSSNSLISTADYLLGTFQFSTLSSWWDTEGQTFTVPVSVPPGLYYIGALVRHDVNQVDDVSYNNSWVLDSVRRIEVTGATTPDLLVESPGVSDASLSPGQSFTASAVVRNLGDATSSSSTLRYYQSSNSVISSADTALGTDFVSSLSAGASSSESETVSAPGAEGTYWIGACVDSVSGESNTSNNCSFGVQVQVASSTAPDLVVVNPAVSDSTLTEGAGYTASATVLNQGLAASGSTLLRYFLSTNSTISTGDTPLGTDVVSSLSAGGSSPEIKSLVAPAAGVYYVGACVDTVSGESNSSNNCSSAVQMTVASGNTCDVVQLGNTTLSGTSTHSACGTLSAGSSTVTGTATFESGAQVVLSEGFQVQPGARLTVKVCDHNLCSTGTNLTTGCHSCVDAICAVDPYCCDAEWDGICVGRVASDCGLTCP